MQQVGEHIEISEWFATEAIRRSRLSSRGLEEKTTPEKMIMQACGWDLDPVILSELVYLCGQAMSEEGTEERTIALPPRGACYDFTSDLCLPTTNSALSANEEAIRELKPIPRYFRGNATFPEDMDGFPEDLSHFDDDHCFAEPVYDVIQYYDDKCNERQLDKRIARSVSLGVPEGYDGPLVPTESVTRDMIEDLMEKARDTLFMTRTAVVEAEMAP